MYKISIFSTAPFFFFFSFKSMSFKSHQQCESSGPRRLFRSCRWVWFQMLSRMILYLEISFVSHSLVFSYTCSPFEAIGSFCPPPPTCQGELQISSPAAARYFIQPIVDTWVFDQCVRTAGFFCQKGKFPSLGLWQLAWLAIVVEKEVSLSVNIAEDKMLSWQKQDNGNASPNGHTLF